ncbi:MAG: DEAD/DEAH box helicase, partial [Candidatus Bathyarchaeia archaeon]
MIEDFIRGLKRSRAYKKQIVHIEELPTKEAKYGDLEKPLEENLETYFLNRGIKFYSHQAQSINIVRAGMNVVIATPTASGKTLAFNVPVFDALALENNATALYLYPTKALTNDQLKVIRDLEKETGIKVDANIYDGDTPKHQRASIRDKSRVILTNPYGLHQYLPWHHLW